MSRFALLLTCEHAGNRVPPAYRGLFNTKRAQRALSSHRGLDIGALAVAKALSQRLGAPLVAHEVTRLLVEPNVSLGHRRLFSEFSQVLTDEEREDAVARHYAPHRARVLQAVEAHRRVKRAVLHIGVHSFVPKLGGRVRDADIGLLYDPARPAERALCARWKQALSRQLPAMRVRRNYPYRGNADGLTTELRKRYGPRRYLGIELELNQALVGGAVPLALLQALASSITNTRE